MDDRNLCPPIQGNHLQKADGVTARRDKETKQVFVPLLPQLIGRRARGDQRDIVRLNQRHNSVGQPARVGEKIRSTRRSSSSLR
jgi:hypothetical protein